MNYHKAMDHGLIIPYEAFSITVKRSAKILALIVFTAAGAQLAVRLPFTPVPVTMQTLFVVLAGITLGPRDGFIAMVSYLALGLAGAPVFAGFAFGPAVFVGVTGGYLLAFPFAALLTGALYRLLGAGRVQAFCAAVSGSVLILAFGTIYLSIITGLSLGRSVALAAIPFIAGEAVKALIAAAVTGRR